jgi:hypothetical protein
LNYKKSGHYNAYFLRLIANRWKEASEAHYRITRSFSKLSKSKMIVNN